VSVTKWIYVECKDGTFDIGHVEKQEALRVSAAEI